MTPAQSPLTTLPPAEADRQELLRQAAKVMGSNAQLGRALGYTSGAFVGQMIRGERPITEKTIRALSGVHKLSNLLKAPPSAGLSKTPVAQHLSLTPFDTPHEFTWEQLMQAKDLPARFVVPVPDGALAGRYEKGTRIVFEVGAAPKPGRPILVEDGAGARYVRLYGGVRGDRWQAIATDLAYATLDAEADQLQLLAAALWIEA